MLDSMPLILRARLAWAHDWVGNAALGAVFQTLPGAAFTVNGAAVPANSALVSAGGQTFLQPELVGRSQIRQRVRLRSKDLRRHRNAQIHVVSEVPLVGPASVLPKRRTSSFRTGADA